MPVKPTKPKKKASKKKAPEQVKVEKFKLRFSVMENGAKFVHVEHEEFMEELIFPFEELGDFIDLAGNTAEKTGVRETRRQRRHDMDATPSGKTTHLPPGRVIEQEPVPQWPRYPSPQEQHDLMREQQRLNEMYTRHIKIQHEESQTGVDEFLRKGGGMRGFGKFMKKAFGGLK